MKSSYDGLNCYKGTQIAVASAMNRFFVTLAATSIFLFSLSLQGQPQGGKSWTHLSVMPANKSAAVRWVQPEKGELFRLDHAAWRAKAAAVRKGEPNDTALTGTEIELPMPDGSTARFKIVETSVMAPELAAKFPEIKTYAGQGIDDPSATVCLDFTPQGFHAQILSPNGAVYVDPAYRGDSQHHVSYLKRDHKKSLDAWRCFVEQKKLSGKGVTTSGQGSGVVLAKVQSGGTMRTYRLAVAATGEYTTFHGGTVPLGQAAIVTAINRINGVFRSELAVQFTLVANNNLLVFTNAGTDPYDNADGFAMLGQNQTEVDGTIGNANYDVGHVFSTGGGGVALTPSICSTGGKAQGVTGNPSPVGDSFWIDFVAHEMGHQFGANHTFNSETDSCSGNRNGSTAMEPGSGSTILAYAGICSPNNLQQNSDPYFHAVSLDEIQSTIASSGGCASTNGTGNTAPTVSAGFDYTIPALTPFILTATGSDANSDPLTYCWEEMDIGAAAALGTADNGNFPLFRSLNPTSSPVRYLPKLSSVLANTNWNQELKPSLARSMTFRVTARDNRSVGGGVTDDEMVVTVAGGTGPFVVTSPNTAVSWSGARTVTWNVAGTAGAPINTSGVNIHMSTNGGNTFTFLLATNAPNNGSAAVVLPNLNSTQARIRVQGAGNIFYDVSDVNFTVSPGSPVPLVQLASTTLIAESCTPTNGAVDPYETVTVSFSMNNVGTAPTTNLTATLLTSNGVFYPSAPQNYGAIAAGGTVSRSFNFIPSGACGGSVTGVVQLADGVANMGTVVQTFSLGKIQSLVVTQVFNSAGAVTIVDNANGSPYPSSINVSGVVGIPTKVTAQLNNVSHTFPNDVDILLVGPGGSVMLLGGAGGGADISGATLTFDDSSANVPTVNGAIPTGTYKPTDYQIAGHSLSAPAPARPYGPSISAAASTPNGTWSLYVKDYAGGDSGSIAGGWSLGFISGGNATNCCTSFPAPTFTSTSYSNNVAQFNWSAIPGPHYQVQYRTNLISGSWTNLGASLLATNTTMGITDSVTNSPMRFYRVIVGP